MKNITKKYTKKKMRKESEWYTKNIYVYEGSNGGIEEQQIPDMQNK